MKNHIKYISQLLGFILFVILGSYSAHSQNISASFTDGGIVLSANRSISYCDIKFMDYESLDVVFGNATDISGQGTLIRMATEYGWYLWDGSPTNGPLNEFILIEYTGVFPQETHIIVEYNYITDTIQLVKNFSISLSDLEFCEGSAPILEPAFEGTAQSYLWSTGETTPSIIPQTDGTYSVTVASTNGEVSSASSEVTIHSLPNINDEDIQECLMPNLILSPGSYDTYLWDDNTTEPIRTVNSIGIYSVVVGETNEFGCSNSGTKTYHVNNAPHITLEDTTVCLTIEGGESSFILAPQNIEGFNCLWSNGSTNSYIEINTSGLYWVAVSNSSGCTTTDSANIRVQNFRYGDLDMSGEPRSIGESMIDATILKNLIYNPGLIYQFELNAGRTAYLYQRIRSTPIYEVSLCWEKAGDVDGISGLTPNDASVMREYAIRHNLPDPSYPGFPVLQNQQQ